MTVKTAHVWILFNMGSARGMTGDTAIISWLRCKADSTISVAYIAAIIHFAMAAFFPIIGDVRRQFRMTVKTAHFIC
ncbi:MAG: hypothetical protein U9Q77_02430 [Candidatus Marinimicrobia bacterium]|nr:hypothetical protein [Candidatus Neomarinimicrobiota bacterium]